MLDFIACTLAKMPMTCGVVLDGTFTQLQDQRTYADGNTVRIVGYIDAATQSLATEFRCIYNNDVVISIPLQHSVLGRSYVSVTIRLNAYKTATTSVVVFDRCASISDCNISIDIANYDRCRILVINDAPATITLEPCYSAYIDGVQLTCPTELQPGIHVLEFRTYTRYGDVIIATPVSMTFGGKKYNLTIYSWGFV